MALSNTQRRQTSGDDLEGTATAIATEILRVRDRWNRFAEFLNLMTAADATAIGLEDLGKFADLRTALNTIVTDIDAESIFDEFKRPLIS